MIICLQQFSSEWRVVLLGSSIWWLLVICPTFFVIFLLIVGDSASQQNEPRSSRTDTEDNGSFLATPTQTAGDFQTVETSASPFAFLAEEVARDDDKNGSIFLASGNEDSYIKRQRRLYAQGPWKNNRAPSYHQRRNPGPPSNTRESCRQTYVCNDSSVVNSSYNHFQNEPPFAQVSSAADETLRENGSRQRENPAREKPQDSRRVDVVDKGLSTVDRSFSSRKNDLQPVVEVSLAADQTVPEDVGPLSATSARADGIVPVTNASASSFDFLADLPSDDQDGGYTFLAAGYENNYINPARTTCRTLF